MPSSVSVSAVTRGRLSLSLSLPPPPGGRRPPTDLFGKPNALQVNREDVRHLVQPDFLLCWAAVATGRLKVFHGRLGHVRLKRIHKLPISVYVDDLMPSRRGAQRLFHEGRSVAHAGVASTPRAYKRTSSMNSSGISTVTTSPVASVMRYVVSDLP